MATASTRSNGQAPDLNLSSHQEQLLYAALDSHHASADSAIQEAQMPMPPDAFSITPLQTSPARILSDLEDSSYLDLEQEFGHDASLDYDQSNEHSPDGNGDASVREFDPENHDKRPHDELDDDEQGGGKRREGDERTPKKPGRKLATAEPTTKRKAQNRAAQRAFRERKEKHLKDLEDKVADLQSASETANHENSKLRAQIEKMSSELSSYKQKLAMTGWAMAQNVFNGGAPYVPGRVVNNPNDVNFQFEFPKFGKAFGSPGSFSATTSSIDSASPILQRNFVSPRRSVNQSPNSSVSQSAKVQPSNGDTAATMARTSAPVESDMSNLSGLFSPSLLNSVSRSSSFDMFNPGNVNARNGSATTFNSAIDYSSPSASSTSNLGPSSSCGTSPEPSTLQSPGHAKVSDSNLTTIGEETGSSAIPFGNANFDLNGIDWLAAQNNNQFDPQLFGDYREPLENILSNPGTDTWATDSFFVDAFPVPDFNTSPNMTNSTTLPMSKQQNLGKPANLLQQIDAKQNSDDVQIKEERTIGCHTIWDRLQACKEKDGDFDLDSLCKDLQKKARCTEAGSSMKEKDFNRIVEQYTVKPATNLS